MKKITRLFMAFALCGAAFVYTSCTDFSEDIKSANTRIDKVETQHSADIKSLQDQATSIQSQVDALKTTTEAADKSITTLKSQVEALEAFRDGSFEQFKKTTTEDIAAIKTQHAADIKNIDAEITSIKARIDALEDFKATAENQIAALQGADEVLAAAVDGKVDTAKFNAFVDKAYEEFAKLSDFTDLKDKFVTLTAGSTMTIAQIESALASASQSLETTAASLKALIETNTGKILANRKSIDSLCTVVSNNCADIENLKTDVAEAQDDITDILEELTTLAKKADVEASLKALAADINAKLVADSAAIATNAKDIDTLQSEVAKLKDKKVDVATYSAKMGEIDGALAATIAQVKADSAAIKALQEWSGEYGPAIVQLKAGVDSLMTAMAALVVRFDDLEQAFVNRIQSLVFVPEYDDLCAQAYDYVVDLPSGSNAPLAQNAALTDSLVCSGWQDVKVSEGESDSWSLGYNVIYGTFQVYPADLAEEIYSQYVDGKVNLYMQFVGLEASRAANDFVVSDALEVIDANNATGYISVRARFATTKIKKERTIGGDEIVDKPGAVSLLVSDKPVVVNSENAEGEEIQVEEEEVDLGRYVASHYAPVAYNNVNVADDYRLANVATLEEYPTRKYQSFVHNSGTLSQVVSGILTIMGYDPHLISGVDLHEVLGIEQYGQEVAKAWDLANSDPKEDYVDFQKDYDVMMFVDEKIMTLEAAADKFFIPVEAITPNLNLSYDYTDYIDLDAKDSTESKTKCFDEFVVDTTKAAVEIQDTNSLKKVINWVEDYVTAESVWTLHNVPVVAAYDKYTIDWRKLELRHALDTLTTVPWTYDFAVAHQDGRQPSEYKEPYTCQGVYDVTATVTDPAKEFKAPEFPSMTDPFEPEHKFYLTDDKSQILDQWRLQIMKPVVDEEAKSITANLYISNYEFSKLGDQYVTCETTYKDKASKSKVIVYYDFMYGQHPTDLTFNFKKDDYYYEPKVTFAAIDTFSFSNAVDSAAAYAGYFKDNDQFLGSFQYASSDCSASKRNDTLSVSTYSYVCLDKDEYPAVVNNPAKVYVRLSQADVKAYKDTYKFVNKLKTWYDVTYTFNADIALKAPGFKLAFWSNKVVEEGGSELYPAPYAMLEGVYENQKSNEYPPFILDGTQGKYIVDQDNLSQYYKLAASDGSAAVVTEAEKPYLKVQYSVTTVEDETIGFKNVPSVSVPEVSVTYQPEYKNFKFGESPITWGDYTARKLATKAVLLCNNVVVNELDLNLYINDPITKFDLKKDEVWREREQNYDYDTAYFWENLVVEGILNNGSKKGVAVNLIDTTAVNADAYLFDNPYDLKLTFSKDDIQILEYKEYAEGNPYKDVTDMLGVQVFYNADEGYIVYNNNSAIRQTDLVVKVKLSLEHKFNYLNNPTYEKEQHYQGLTYILVWPKQQLEPGNAAE